VAADRLWLGDASTIRYCDIGANHPRTLNNTFALYQRGGDGFWLSQILICAAR